MRGSTSSSGTHRGHHERPRFPRRAARPEGWCRHVSGTDAREQAARPAEPAAVADGPTLGLLPEQAGAGRTAQASGPVTPVAGGHVAAGRRRPGHGRLAGVVVVIVAAAGVGGAYAAGVFRSPGSPSAASSSQYPTGTATVSRGSLSSQTPVSATLGDAGSYAVVVPESPTAGGAGSAGAGTYTWLPAVGTTIGQGQVMYQVSGSPVVLLYGAEPAWRSLAEGMTGQDVRQLNTDLVALGYASAAALGPRSGWNYYSAETAYALDGLQSRLGLTATGALDLGQAVFLPGPALISALGTGVLLGGPATPGSVVLTATSTTPVVTINLNPAQQTEVKTGDKVAITLPDGGVTPGVISQVGMVATAGSGTGGSGSATITVLVSLTNPKAAGHLSQAPVEVTITVASVSNVLMVPVDALLAQPGGGYAVEVTGSGGHHLVTVTPGLFDDAAGLVQVTSTSLTPGQHVVVPGL